MILWVTRRFTLNVNWGTFPHECILNRFALRGSDAIVDFDPRWFQLLQEKKVVDVKRSSGRRFAFSIWLITLRSHNKINLQVITYRFPISSYVRLTLGDVFFVTPRLDDTWRALMSLTHDLIRSGSECIRITRCCINFYWSRLEMGNRWTMEVGWFEPFQKRVVRATLGQLK